MLRTLLPPVVLQADPAQMKMAAKMMASMSPQDMERMTCMAASMGMGPGTAAAAGGGGGAAAAPGAAAALAGMPPGGFDPSSMPAGMMDDMRKRMQDPEVLKMMKVGQGRRGERGGQLLGCVRLRVCLQASPFPA